jgi:hypothetical protein
VPRAPGDAPRLRLLCLHGFRQSGAGLAGRLAAMRQRLEGIAELCFVEAPHALPELLCAIERALEMPRQVVLAGAKACCDITGAIAPNDIGRNGAMFFIFLIFIGTMFTVTLSFIAGCRYIYSFSRGNAPGADRAPRSDVASPDARHARRSRLSRQPEQADGVRGAAHQGAAGLHFSVPVAGHFVCVLLDQREPRGGLRRSVRREMFLAVGTYNWRQTRATRHQRGMQQLRGCEFGIQGSLIGLIRV